MADRHSAVIAYAQDARETAFRPGKHDCATFAAGWVKRCGGPDLMKGLRSKYSSLKKGRELAAEMGYATELDVVVAHLHEVPRLMAQSGDVAWIEDGESAGFGLVAGEIVYCLTPKGGMGHVPLDRAARVFRP